MKLQTSCPVIVGRNDGCLSAQDNSNSFIFKKIIVLFTLLSASLSTEDNSIFHQFCIQKKKMPFTQQVKLILETGHNFLTFCVS